MRRLKLNVVANLASSAWSTILALALVPLYIKLLGIEAYGLVGVFTALQALFALLDLGLSTTVNRELARLSASEDTGQRARDLVRTVEVVYWAIACLIGVTIISLAPLIAGNWVHRQNLPTSTIQQAVISMGLVIALQFPAALYTGGLLGLQRQVWLNVLAIALITMRGLGAIALLWFVSPSIVLFFLWQLVVVVLQTGLTASMLWRSLPRGTRRAGFHKELWRGIWRFAAGVTIISLLGVLLSQADKIVLSTVLTLDVFGIYVLAGNVAVQLATIAAPIYNAIFPQVSRLTALGDDAGRKKLYHTSAQLVSVAVLPVAVVLALFPVEVVQLWTRDPLVADRAHWIVTFLVIGSAFNSLLYIPNAIMLGTGWTKLLLWHGLIAVLLYIPALYLASTNFGAEGAACAWIGLNAASVLIVIPIMHRRLLKGELARWYFRDVGLPLVAALSVAAIGRLLFPTAASALVTLGALAAVSACTLVAAILAASDVRAWALARLTRTLRPAAAAQAPMQPSGAILAGATAALGPSSDSPPHEGDIPLPLGEEG